MFEKCEYVISAVSPKQYPNKTNLPEYVFLGRSNVGKSSLINAITGRKLLAKTSSKPGKTQTINFFIIDDRFYLIDVPGYGYASRSIEQRLAFGSYIENYLTDNPRIKIAFLLVDTKVGPTKDDVLMYEFLQHLQINTIVLATKSDKIGKTHLFRHEKVIRDKLPNATIIYTSSESKVGIDKVVQLISA